MTSAAKAATDFDPGILGGSPGYLLWRTHKIFTACWNEHREAVGVELTPVQAGVLFAVIDEPGLNQRELARKLRVEAATLTQSLDKLDADGLVERRRIAEDRRSRRLNATAAGREAAAAARRFTRFCDEVLTSDLNGDERRAFLSLLDKITAGDGFRPVWRPAQAVG